MNRELVKTATTGGANSPWETLLRAGAEVLREAANGCPKPTAREPIAFFAPDASETMTEAQADFLLKTRQLPFGAATGKRFPPSRLLAFLDRVSGENWEFNSSRRLSEKALASLGGAGARLLALYSNNAVWKRVLPAEFPYATLDDETFLRETTRVAESSASPRVRAKALRALASRFPDASRRVLERVWDGNETIDAKKLAALQGALIPTVWVGLSAADVPFLEEKALNSSVAVARVAIKMLATIPESRYYRELRELADALVTDDGKFVPPTYSRELKKLGFPKRDDRELGARIIGTIPLSHWEKRFEAAPEEIVERFSDDYGQEPIFAGWRAALVHFGAGVEWVRALNASCPGRRITEFSDQTLMSFINDSNNEYGTSVWFAFSQRAGQMAPETEAVKYVRVNRDLASGAREKDFAELTACEEYNPNPWSDELCKERFRLAFEEPASLNNAERVAWQIEAFPRAMRDKIVAELERLANRNRAFAEPLEVARENASKINCAEQLFGEFHRKSLDRSLFADELDEILPWRPEQFEGRV
ncbi:MAG: hypothetical protein IJM30_10460 [Thermoguttaceae bacterium]|nr:hypothetical protein [Thermoguttaceae bacterium]